MFYILKAKPAYNRNYSNAADMLKDWFAGKDFYSINNSAYFSIRDLPYLKRDGALAIDFYFNASLKEFHQLAIS